MGFLVPVAFAIAAAVTAAVAVVLVVVATVVTVVVAAVAAVAAAVAGALAATVAAVGALAGSIVTAVSTAIGPIAAAIYTELQVMYWGLYSYVMAISQGFSAFLTAIHFKTLLAMHDLAYMLSEDYRAIMNKVYKRVAEVSEALGFYPQFLALAFRNTRNVILSVSGLLGRKFDMAEIGWLSQWNDYMKWMSNITIRFQDSPEEIFQSLDDYFLKGAIDTSATSMLTVYDTIQDALLSLKVTVTEITELRDGVDTLVEDLPETIKKHVTPITDPIIGKFDEFQAQIYDPSIARLDGILNGISSRMEQHREDIANLVDDLKRPGDMMDELKFLSAGDRFDQEEKIRKPVFRQHDGEMDDFKDVYMPHHTELQKLAMALEYEPTPVEWKVPEVEAPGRPAGARVEPRKTWDVGDY